MFLLNVFNYLVKFVCVCFVFFSTAHIYTLSPAASFTYFVSFPPLFLAFAYISQTVEIVLQTKLSLAQVENRMHMLCFNSCDIIMCLSCIHWIVLNLKIVFKNKHGKKPNKFKKKNCNGKTLVILIGNSYHFAYNSEELNHKPFEIKQNKS